MFPTAWLCLAYRTPLAQDFCPSLVKKECCIRFAATLLCGQVPLSFYIHCLVCSSPLHHWKSLGSVPGNLIQKSLIVFWAEGWLQRLEPLVSEEGQTAVACCGFEEDMAESVRTRSCCGSMCIALHLWGWHSFAEFMRYDCCCRGGKHVPKYVRILASVWWAHACCSLPCRISVAIGVFDGIKLQLSQRRAIEAKHALR